MVMKPGCQKRLVHRVCRNGSSDENNSGRRIVISFRKLSSDENDPEISVNLNKSTAADYEENSFQGPATKVTVIAGDSHTVGLNADKLGRKGKKTVVNLSESGAKIGDVQKSLEKFCMSDEHANGKLVVEKVFISVGTNDIRNCLEKGTRSLNSPLLYLAEQVKLMFPDAVVWFQNMIPLPWQNKYTYSNVEEFNKIIMEVCRHAQTFYLDIFNEFLVYNPYYGFSYRHEDLFIHSKNIHLNRLGLSILARRYINLIHSSFNPLGY